MQEGKKVKGVVLVEDRKMKYLVHVVEERAKDPVHVKGGRINYLGCVEDQRISLANLGQKLEDHKEDVAKTKWEVVAEKGKRQWQADLSVC